MGFSRSARIITLLIIDTAFFFLVRPFDVRYGRQRDGGRMLGRCFRREIVRWDTGTIQRASAQGGMHAAAAAPDSTDSNRSSLSAMQSARSRSWPTRSTCSSKRHFSSTRIRYSSSLVGRRRFRPVSVVSGPVSGDGGLLAVLSLVRRMAGNGDACGLDAICVGQACARRGADVHMTPIGR